MLAVICIALVAQAGQSDSLYQMALREPEPPLVVEARSRPLVLRETIAEALARSVREPAGADEALRVARRLAQAFAAAWNDSYLVRQVERFGTASPAWRARKVRADSLRRAGVEAWSREGPVHAIAIWKRALTAYRSIGDSAGQGGTMDNLGAGFLAAGRLDSAASLFRIARRLAVAVGDIRLEANVLGHSADVEAERGKLTAALAGYAEASRLRARVGDTRGVAADHNNQGLIARELGDFDGAERHFTEALAINRAEGRPEVAATNLVNLAGVASFRGDLVRARGYYEDALATWREREEWAQAAAALAGLGGLELRRGDYPAARRALGEALTIYERAGLITESLDVRSTLADALSASGNLQGAITELARADSIAIATDAGSSMRGEIALGQGDLAYRLNDLPEARRRYHEASRWFTRAGEPDRDAAARHGQALVALARDDSADAELLLNSVLRRQVAGGDGRSAAITRITLAEIRWRRGSTAEARRMLASATQELIRVDDPVALAEALGVRGALETGSGFASTGEGFYREGLRRMEGHTSPQTVWRLRAGLAEAFLAQGAIGAGAREFRLAVDAMEVEGGSLVLPERRSAFLADKWETYARLAFVERKRGLHGAAFEVAERLRARETLELLRLGRVEAPASGPADLVSREQDLRRRMVELSLALDRSVARNEPTRGPDASRLEAATRQSLLDAQGEYTDLLLQLRERAPRHAAFVAPRTAKWEDVARRLSPDQAFVSYLLGDSTSVAFVITRDSMVSVDLGVRRRELARLVEFARGTMDRAPTDSIWRGPFRRLYHHLIDPVEETGLLDGKSRLVIVPHAELHYLPFAALLREDRGDFLVDRYVVELAPSATVWLTVGDRPRATGDTRVLAMAPRPDALPASRLEVTTAARSSGFAVESRIGPEATESEFRRSAMNGRILHLATYGVFNKQNPLFSYVELGPGGGHDGHLEVHEVLGLDLAADLVILSACQTGLGSGAIADVPAGDDWVGLTRAFLHAGANQVLATLWPVNDWATAQLIGRFYRALGRTGDVSGALAEAQRQVREEFRTADPFYWAGFVIVGGAPSLRGRP